MVWGGGRAGVPAYKSSPPTDADIGYPVSMCISTHILIFLHTSSFGPTIYYLYQAVTASRSLKYGIMLIIVLLISFIVYFYSKFVMFAN